MPGGVALGLLVGLAAPRGERLAVRVQGGPRAGELVARGSGRLGQLPAALRVRFVDGAFLSRQGRVDRALRERDVVRILPLGLGAFPLRVGLAQGRQGLLVPGVGEQGALVGRGPNLRRRGLEPPALGEGRVARRRRPGRPRSEQRRGGKECRSRGAPEH